MYFKLVSCQNPAMGSEKQETVLRQRKKCKKKQQEYSVLPVDKMVRPKDDLDLGNKFGVREFRVPLQGSTDVLNCFHEKKNRP